MDRKKMNRIEDWHPKAVMRTALLAAIAAMAQTSALADTTISAATTTPQNLASGNLTITSAAALA
jgi:uncharacterized protein YraI